LFDFAIIKATPEKETIFKEQTRKILLKRKIDIDIEKAVQRIWEWFFENQAEMDMATFNKICQECKK
jgi:hypothetical protein